MTNLEKMNNIYSAVVEGGDLTTKRLNNLGFNSKDLNDLIKEGKLERVKRGLYQLKDVDGLFHYGKRLIAKRNLEKADLCFEKCYLLDPNHLGTCFQMFLRNIKRENYEKVFELYDKLSKSDNEYYNKDLNYYLYLLSIITKVPQKNREYARYLTFDDMKVSLDDKRYSDTLKENQIRSCALNRKFAFALSKQKELISAHGYVTVQDMVARDLLYQAVCRESISKETILDLIKAKKYDEIVYHLLEKEKMHKLSENEGYILKLVYEILALNKTDKITVIKPTNSKSLFEAIDNKDFHKALKFSNEYSRKNNFSKDSNPIYLLLDEICILTKEKINKAKKENEESKSVQNPEVNFSSIATNLINGNVEKSIEDIRIYLKSIKKSNYEFLIIDLIKLCILEKDNSFMRPLFVLSRLNDNSYSFDISKFIQEFYVSLSQNEFEECHIYLDIISSAHELGQECIITDGLYQILEITEKNAGYIQYSSHSDILTSDKEESLTKEEENKTFIENVKQPQKSIEVKEEKSERDYIDKKYQELLEQQGVVLLKPMTDSRIDRTLDILEEYKDVDAFAIGENERQIVLRYNPKLEFYEDVKTLIDKGNYEYRVKNNDGCIEAYLKLLQIFDKPKAITYSRIGLSYARKHEKAKAIDYLTIANYLAKQEKTDLDFTELIMNLKGELSRKDVKVVFKMKEEEFSNNDANNFFGIEDFAKINSHIVSSGLDVESACEELGMTPEQIDIVRLIYAREFYIQGDFKRGDLFLKTFERSKDKTEATKKIYAEINKNKKFYKNRGEKHIDLTLALVPKKK